MGLPALQIQGARARAPNMGPKTSHGKCRKSGGPQRCPGKWWFVEPPVLEDSLFGNGITNPPLLIDERDLNLKLTQKLTFFSAA